MHCLTAWGQWAVETPQRTATLAGGCGLWAVGLVQCTATALWQWGVQLPQCTASPPGGRGQWKSCNALPHCLGAVGNGSPVMDCHGVWGQWATEVLQCMGLPAGGMGSPA